MKTFLVLVVFRAVQHLQDIRTSGFIFFHLSVCIILCCIKIIQGCTMFFVVVLLFSQLIFPKECIACKYTAYQHMPAFFLKSEGRTFITVLQVIELRNTCHCYLQNILNFKVKLKYFTWDVAVAVLKLKLFSFFNCKSQCVFPLP